jgi:hypothetical protein
MCKQDTISEICMGCQFGVDDKMNCIPGL